MIVLNMSLPVKTGGGGGGGGGESEKDIKSCEIFPYRILVAFNRGSEVYQRS